MVGASSCYLGGAVGFGDGAGCLFGVDLVAGVECHRLDDAGLSQLKGCVTHSLPPAISYRSWRSKKSLGSLPVFSCILLT